MNSVEERLNIKIKELEDEWNNLIDRIIKSKSINEIPLYTSRVREIYSIIHVLREIKGDK